MGAAAGLEMHGDPANCQLAATLPAHPLTADQTLTGYRSCGTEQARVLKSGLPTPPQKRGCRHDHRPSDGPPRP